MPSLQVHPHPDGVLVAPGWLRYLLLLPQTGDSAPEHPVHGEAAEPSKARTFPRELLTAIVTTL